MTAVLAAAAFLYPGVKSADVDLNDGGVWVTNKSIGMTARLNYPSKTLDGGVTPPGAGFDILQHEGEVFVDEGSALTAVDPAAMRLGEPVRLPDGVTASAGQGALVFADPETGEAWLASTDTPGELRQENLRAGDFRGAGPAGPHWSGRSCLHRRPFRPRGQPDNGGT